MPLAAAPVSDLGRPPQTESNVPEIVSPPPILTEQEKKTGTTRKKKSLSFWLALLLFGLARTESLGTAISLTIHFFILVVLALLVTQVQSLPEGLLSGGFVAENTGIEQTEGGELELADASPSGPDLGNSDSVRILDLTDREVLRDFGTEAAREPSEVETEKTGSNLKNPNLLDTFGAGGGFEGRTAESRGRRGGPGDPTDRSEAAVEAGLRWIVIHQNRKDGGWSFELECPCGKPSGVAPHRSRTAATAFALLPFLGAGYTHLEGQYKTNVERGLRFLLDPANAVELSVGTNFQQYGQGMYSQGVAAIVFCEAYGMTKGKAKNRSERDLEQKLREAAQGAIRYLEFAQDRGGEFPGGWRYKAGETPGDISVTGWQGIALKSALLAGIEVKSTTLSLLEDFLDSTHYTLKEESRFNYLPVRFSYSEDLDSRESVGRFADSPYTCTAIGHLLELYLGKTPGYPLLDSGISLLDRWGPLKTEKKSLPEGNCNLYYAYYGTLAIHHYGGSAWNRWYPEIREFLVNTQSRGETIPHEGGSWFFPDPYCNTGGRLLATSLAVMILETRYRYLSLYGTD